MTTQHINCHPMISQSVTNRYVILHFVNGNDQKMFAVSFASLQLLKHFLHVQPDGIA